MIIAVSLSLFILLVATHSGLLPFVDLQAQQYNQAPLDPRFEVASVKLSDPADQLAASQPRDWGEASGRVVLRHVPLRYLLLRAYEIDSRQLSAPAWLDDTFVDVLAKAPSGATKEQFP